MILQHSGKFFHDGGFACASHSEVTHGDNLHAKWVIADDARFVKPAAAFYADEENLGETKKHPAQSRGAFAAALVENHLQREGFKLFLPGTERLAHWTECAG